MKLKYILLGLVMIMMIFPAMAVQLQNVASPIYDERSVTGEVTFMMRGIAVMDKTVWLANKISPNNWMKIDILPMGISNPIRVIPGNFTAVKDGNGGQPERQDFPVLLGDNKRVVFIGHCITQHGKIKPVTPTPTPTPSQCTQARFTYVDNGYGNPATYIFDNADAEQRTVYVDVTEDYWYEECPETVGCVRPTPTPTPVPTPTPLPCVRHETTRVLASSSHAVPPGHTVYQWEIPRSPNHIRYNFRVETICV